MVGCHVELLLIFEDKFEGIVMLSSMKNEQKAKQEIFHIVPDQPLLIKEDFTGNSLTL